MEEATGNCSLVASSTTSNLRFMTFSQSQVQLKDLVLLTFTVRCLETTTQTLSYLVESAVQLVLLFL